MDPRRLFAYVLALAPVAALIFSASRGLPQVLKQFTQAEGRGDVARLWSPFEPAQAGATR